jgi:hypothetical protein
MLEEQPKKRGRGRPRKNPVSETQSELPLEGVGGAIKEPAKSKSKQPESQKDSSKQQIERKEGPLKWQRDLDGLLGSIEYIFNDDGSINWLEMVPSEYLGINKQWYRERDREPPLDIKECYRPDQKFIRLAGLRLLASWRGYTRLEYKNVLDTTDEVRYEEQKYSEYRHGSCVTCEIEFIGNYETEGKPKIHSDRASATVENTNKLGAMYPQSIAANRAFARCVRGFLNIPVVADEELAAEEFDENKDSNKHLNILGVLKKNLKAHALVEDFEDFKHYLTLLREAGEFDHEDAEEWQDFSDIRQSTVILQLLKIVSESGIQVNK